MKRLIAVMFSTTLFLAACAPGTTTEPLATPPAEASAPAETVQIQPFITELSGNAQVPPVPTLAFGSATVSLLAADDPAEAEMVASLSLNGTFQGLESDLIEVAGSSAHIHEAPRGETGPVVFPIEVSPNPDLRSGSFALTANLTQDQLDAFLAGNYYINIHTEANPAGELRGQLLPGG